MDIRPQRSAPSWIAAVLLLLPPVFFLQPVPIDETRYLAVAWNMHLRGEWLVPWLDGLPYSDKPPLLFWLINLVWAITGVHAWAARLMELLVALATLPLLASLGRQFELGHPGVETAQWLWLGCAATAAFAGAVMFDMPLTLVTLVAWRAVFALRGPRWPVGMLVMALALGAGILIKGPVALLVGGLPALLAPWWLPAPNPRPTLFYARMLGALGGAAAVALAWAVPAGRAGGPAYADAIFLHQTVGRVVTSFAHDRPWWWYLAILPVMLVPWVLGIGRGSAPGAVPERQRATDRFVLASFVPGIVVFSLISGKQPHYLLPLLPALALAAGSRLGDGRWRVVGWRIGFVLAAIGLAVAVGFGRLAPPAASAATWFCGVLIIVLGVLFISRRARPQPAGRAALGMLATLGLAKLAFVLSIGHGYDMRAVSRRVAEAQRAGIPLLYAGKQAGLFTFAGRLTMPIPAADTSETIAAWTRAHPDGWVISGDSRFRYAAAPLYRQSYLGRSLCIWRAGDVGALAARDASGHAAVLARRH
jgi:4-amino-4-deoxy-L-arabinose transferase-like glycosyltransferase